MALRAPAYPAEAPVFPSVGLSPRFAPFHLAGAPVFRIKGREGIRFDIEVSVDLTGWTVLTPLPLVITNTAANYIDYSATDYCKRFYRAIER